MSLDKYSGKALKHLLSLLAIGAGGATIHNELPSPNTEDTIRQTYEKLPPGVNRQPRTEKGAKQAVESGLSMPNNLGGLPGRPSIQPVRPGDVIFQPIAPPPFTEQKQHVPPNPVTKSMHTWRGGASPGGKAHQRARDRLKGMGGGRVIYNREKIKTISQKISNRELLKKMKQEPHEPQPVKLTEDGLKKYLGGHTMPDVRETIRNLNGHYKGTKR